MISIRKNELVQAVKISKKIPEFNDLGGKIISEIELAYGFIEGKIVAVTGSNGKSTTVSLLGKIFSDAKIPTFVAGNIGNPLSAICDKTTDDHVTIIELSSFQLERISDFKADIALLLNLTPDHLNRYDGLEGYYDTKLRIFKNQDQNDISIINFDDQNIQKLTGCL